MIYSPSLFMARIKAYGGLPRSRGPPCPLGLEGEGVRDSTAFAVDRSHGRVIVTALDLAGQAGWPWGSNGVAAQLLHAIGETIDPPSRFRAAMGGPLADPHEVFSAGIEATDIGL